jgi:hypothetical protein
MDILPPVDYVREQEKLEGREALENGGECLISTRDVLGRLWLEVLKFWNLCFFTCFINKR